MTAQFAVCTTPHFDRLLRSLLRHHPELASRYRDALHILRVDPHNRSRTQSIRKLEAVGSGEGEYRLRLGRWRFRYDISGNEVVLHYCGLRREDTYR